MTMDMMIIIQKVGKKNQTKKKIKNNRGVSTKIVLCINIKYINQIVYKEIKIGIKCFVACVVCVVSILVKNCVNFSTCIKFLHIDKVDR